MKTMTTDIHLAVLLVVVTKVAGAAWQCQAFWSGNPSNKISFFFYMKETWKNCIIYSIGIVFENPYLCSLSSF